MYVYRTTCIADESYMYVHVMYMFARCTVLVRTHVYMNVQMTHKRQLSLGPREQEALLAQEEARGVAMGIGEWSR